MDVLRPGHAHRSSSDRLLNNYLESQKSLNTSLLTLLSHSHASTSSLLAYVTSSPGVLHPIRRSVRHAGFEGPISSALVEEHGGSQIGSLVGEDGAPGWATYIQGLDRFRKDLKQIHLLEEEMSRVKRDREILVTRLIKSTKSRPTKSDLAAIATSYSQSNMSSRASSISVTSAGSSASKEGRRAGKLASAQAELLGCEEHLRSLEVRIEEERNKVMMRGLEERFRAMEAVGRMWVTQAKKGMTDLERIHELPPDAFELDSNPSIAPSQSASQIGYEDSPARRNGNGTYRRPRDPPGSITGSIAEEDEEGSSDDGNRGNFVVHENRPSSGMNTFPRAGNNNSHKPSPLGVPSVNSRSRPLSSTYGNHNNNNNDGDSSDGEFGNPRAGGRRAASDIGALPYHPPNRRQPLRRTFSNDDPPIGLQRRNSDGSSFREHTAKKKGFFARISRFFKGNGKASSIRSGRDSPPYGSSSRAGGGWSTRTDGNLKRSASAFGHRGRGAGGGDSSSSDEEGGNLVSVSNNRSGGWSVDQVGRAPVGRSSHTPVASGLIPSKPANRRTNSQSTITRDSGNVTPRAASPIGQTRFPAASGSLSRSNTMKSTASNATARSANTATGSVRRKSGVPAGSVGSKTTGAMARARLDTRQAAEGRNIMSLVDMKTPPVMPEVPKAPKSQVSPQMELARAPGSALISSGATAPAPRSATPAANGSAASTGAKQSFPAGSGTVPAPTSKPTMNRSNSQRSNALSEGSRASALPPSRTLQPPLKSALRPTTPSPPSLAPPVDIKMYSITAPGPIDIPREEEKPIPIPMPAAKPKPKAEVAKAVAAARPAPAKRNSFQSQTTDGESVYESAVEGEHGQEDDEQPGQAAEDGDSSDEEEDDADEGKYKVVDNPARGEFVAGPDEVVRVPQSNRAYQDEDGDEGDETASEHTTTAMATSTRGEPVPAYLNTGDNQSIRRKSVRITAPDSPLTATTPTRAPAAITDSTNSRGYVPEIAEDARASSPPPERATDAQWDTRIGRMREDTSDEEEDLDEAYKRARKGLQRNTGKWEVTPPAIYDKKGKKVTRSASVKSKASSAGGKQAKA